MIQHLVNRENIESVLEIGPASGYITKGICEVLGTQENITFDILDFSDNFIKSTKNRGLNIANSYTADICALNFNIGKYYDLILCQEVIEHLTCPFVALSNINKILKNNAYLFLTIPNSLYYGDIMGILKHVLANKIKTIKDTHIAEISIIGMIKLLSMSGFEIEKIYWYGSKKPLLNIFTSKQVGFLARKIAKPEEVWCELERNILEYWRFRNV